MCGPKEGSISKGRSVKMKYVVSLKTYVCTAKHLAKFFPTFFKIPATFCPRTPFWKIAFFFYYWKSLDIFLHKHNIRSASKIEMGLGKQFEKPE